MMIPDMSDAVEEFEENVKIFSVTYSSSDFSESKIITVRNQLAIVEVAKPEDLQALTIDFSLSYIAVYSRYEIAMAEYVEWNGKKHKVISIENWAHGGYYKAICEERKQPL
jgi:hypothetical protein